MIGEELRSYLKGISSSLEWICIWLFIIALNSCIKP